MSLRQGSSRTFGWREAIARFPSMAHVPFFLLFYHRIHKPLVDDVDTILFLWVRNHPVYF